MKTTFDRNLFTQIGLDSGSLTMLGAVTHSFGEPGEYRGSVRQREKSIAVFYILADKNSPVAQANVDLSALGDTDASISTCSGDGHAACNRFKVNPKGYAVFHVSGGPGGYDIRVRKADEDPRTKIFDSRQLNDGDIFSGVIIRPGSYSITNLLTAAHAEATVAYPIIGKTAYRPPAPVRVQCTRDGFDLKRIELQPGQGLIFDCKAPSRIKIELVKPDDGSRGLGVPTTTRGKKTAVLKK